MYFSPERYNTYVTGNELKKADIWCIGLILFQILYKINDFSLLRNNEFKYSTNNTIINVSYNCINFMKHLLDTNVEKRYNISQCFQHSWLINNNNIIKPPNYHNNNILKLYNNINISINVNNIDDNYEDITSEESAVSLFSDHTTPNANINNNAFIFPEYNNIYHHNNISSNIASNNNINIIIPNKNHHSILRIIFKKYNNKLYNIKH